MEEKAEEFQHDNLTDKEKEDARQNGFILVGKTGTGKTTLLNALFNKIMGIAGDSAISVTKISSVYYYKLTNGKVICLVDTPGLADTETINNKNIDNIHLDGITKIISEEKIHIKGILFLVNFKSKRFDASEQEALLNYNTIFPLKNFWKSMVIVYTHFYPDPNEDEDEEDMKKSRSISNGEIFEKIMEKVKGVSDVISYNDLKIKYFNSYSVCNNSKKRKSNERTRNELEVIFEELSKNSPLFHQIEVKHMKNHKWTENGKEYIGEVEIIGFFDLNNEPIKERLNVIKKEEVIKNYNYPSSSCDYYVYNATRSSSGYIQYQSYKGNENNSKYLKAAGGGIVAGGLGAGGTALAIYLKVVTLSSATPAGPVVAAVGAIGLGIGALFGLFS